MEYVLSIIGRPSVSLRKIVSPLASFGLHIKDHFIPHHRNNYHPHILGHRAMALFSGLLVTVKIFTIVLVSIGPVLPAFSSAITPENIINLTNASRKDYSLSALTENSILDKAAQAKAQALLDCQCFSHNLPDGRTPWDFFAAAGYNYLMAGENLAVNFTEAENVETAWMNSPGHKANIVNKNFEEIGIGISQGEYMNHSAIFVVQLFGTPVEQKVQMLPSPTAVQTQSVPAPVPVAVTTPKPKQETVASTKTTNPAPAPAAPLAMNNAKPTAPSSTEPGSNLLTTAQELQIQDAQVMVSGNLVNISAKVSSNATKVLAYFGQSAVMLTAKDNFSWQGSIDLSKLAKGNMSVRIVASDMTGTEKTLQLADFTASTVDNYNVLNNTAQSSPQVSWLGKIFNPKVFEQKFYLLFITAILVSLIMAIGIKRHIQHLSLIANSSFVIILAALLLMAG